METVREPLLILAGDLRVLRANRAFYRTFQVTPDETENRLLYELGNGQWDIPALRRLLEGVLPRQETFDDFEVVHDFPTLGQKVMLLNARRVVDGSAERRAEAILLAIEDITQRRQFEHEQQRTDQALRASEQRLRALVTASGAVLYQMSADWSEMQPLDGKGLVVSNDAPIRDWLQRNIPPSEHAPIRAQIARCIATKSAFEMEHRVKRPDGSIGWTHSRAVPVLNDAGEILEWVGTAEDVTDRKRAEQELRESEERFRVMADAVPQLVWITSADGQVEFCNQQWFAYTGITELPATAGEVGARIVHPDDQQPTMAAFEDALRTGTTYRVEHRIRSRSGEYRWFLVRGEPYRDKQDGRIISWFGTSTDIHDRRAMEDALRASEDRLRAVFEQTEAGIAQVDLSGRFLFVNERYTQIVGRTREQLQHLRMQDITHPEDLARNLPMFQRAIDDGEPFVIEKRYVRPDGTEVWVNNSVSLTRDADGKPSGVVAATVDITDRRRAEQALRESEQHARRIIDNTVAFVGVMTPDGTLTEANATALRAGGLQRDDVIGRKFWDCYWWSYDPEIQQQLRDAIRRATSGEIVRYDVIVRMAGDTRMPIDFMLSPVRDERGRITHLIPSGTDITHRKRAEEALRESEARLRQAVAIAEMGTFHIDLLTDAVTVNDAGRKIYGWAPDMPLTFSKVQSFFHPDDHAAVMRRVADAFRPDGPGEFEIEQRIIRADGAIRWIRVRGWAIFEDAHGTRRAIRCVGTYLDTTDQKESERRREELLTREREARAEAERTSRMKDEFLATLSHELRTPLNAILGWSQILAGGTRDQQEFLEAVRTIERNARAQTQIIEDLLDMSRIISGKVRLDVQRLDLATVVREAVESVRPSADAKGIRLQAVLDPRAGPVTGDPARLQQVLWNLLTNAVKFTPKGGRVQVLLERVNSHLEVSVIDTGEGISPEFLPHVFDRFRQADASTTRRHGGLGLGLSIVKQLVELHGGSVRVKSAGAGKGATFIVALPLTVIHPDPHPGEHREHPQTPSPPDADDWRESCAKIAGLKVLVVDDEPDARLLIKRLLEDCN
ncbi:MAG TPA: PAS domain S-box protein, partial [Tepidisphaeraceae bacterium]|nr:PAS domain S-box protein [Tepidisphaeraceae bacterium]